MEKDKIYAELPAIVPGATIIPIVKVTSDYRDKIHAISYFGLKRPIGVIVISPTYTKSFRINGEEAPLDDFIKQVPDLETIMQNYQHNN